MQSWQERIAMVDVKGEHIPPTLDLVPEPQRTYTIATTGYAARNLRSVLASEPSIMLRDATIAYLRTRGFSS